MDRQNMQQPSLDTQDKSQSEVELTDINNTNSVNPAADSSTNESDMFSSELGLFHILMHQDFFDSWLDIYKKIPKCSELISKRFLGALIIICQAAVLIFKLLKTDSKYFDLGAGISSVFLFFFFLIPTMQFNIFDLFFNAPRTWKNFSTMARVIWIALTIFYLAATIFYPVAIYEITPKYFPNVNQAKYVQNTTTWYKDIDVYSQFSTSFCNIHSKFDTLKIDDLSMLTTLPRLYSFNDENKCYIKPSKRNIFNTTMKYIFGQNYEAQNIRIMCKHLYHGIALVVTSDRQKYYAMSMFGRNITILPDQFRIKNNDYFKNISFANLTDELYEYYQDYSICLNNSTSPKNCQQYWDTFEYYYWKIMYTDEYANLSGLERYQITIEDNMVIQPQFITENGDLMSGVHYVVGGAIENNADISIYLEMLARTYIPILFDNILLFFASLSKFLKDMFNAIDWLNRYIIYPSRSIPLQMTDLTTLYSQFNFSHDAIFTVGTSFSGAVQKGVSYFTDISGVSINSGLGNNLGHFKINTSFKITTDQSTNQISDIAMYGHPLMGIDSDFKVYGWLPKRYGITKLPNPYETACLTSVTCSTTMKYLPYCEQVLADTIDKGRQELFEDIEAYYDFY